jgi:hypothetical protein
MLEELQVYLKSKLSWDREKVNSVIIPIIKEMSRKKANNSQTTLDRYFSVTPKKHPSKRVNEAIGSSGGSEVLEKKKRRNPVVGHVKRKKVVDY